jgi:hypothetical protein
LSNGYRHFRGTLFSPTAGYKRHFENGSRSFLRNTCKIWKNYTLFLPTRAYLCLVFCKPFSQSISSYFLTYSNEPNCSSLSDSILLHKSGTGRCKQSAHRPRSARILQSCCFQYGTPLQCNNFVPSSIVNINSAFSGQTDKLENNGKQNIFHLQLN